MPSGDGNEGNVLGVESDLLDEVGGFTDDLLVTGFGVLGGIHLVDGDDELTNTEGEGEEGVFTGLSILGDTSLELTSSGGDDEDSAIGLRGTSDHVLDEITVTRSIDNGDHVLRKDENREEVRPKLPPDDDRELERTYLGGFELPESDIDGDTTLTLGLELVKNPRVLEGT